MSRTSRAIFAGVGAGLTSFGQGLQQQAVDERVDARLAKDDAFKDRRLSIAEKDLELRQQAAKTQKFFDDTKMQHLKYTQGWMAADGNKIEEARLRTNLYPGHKIWTYDQNATDNMAHPDTGEKPFAVMGISYPMVDKTTGEVKPDPMTGGPMHDPSYRGPSQKVWWSEAEYNKDMAGHASPEMFTAFKVAESTVTAEIEAANRRADAIAQTIQGKSALELEKQQAEEKKESAALKKRTDPNLRAGAAADRQKSTMQNLPGHPEGKTSNLTTPEMNQRKDDANKWNEKIEGITAQEVRYIEQGREMFPGFVDSVGQMVINKGSSKKEKAAAISVIEEKFKVSPTTARGMLRIAMQDKESTERGFFGNLADSLFGENVPTDEQF